MSETPRTPEEIEAELAQLRSDMTSTVDELMDHLDPKANAKRAAEEVKDIMKTTGTKAQVTIEEAKKGDPRAVKMVAIAGAGILAVGGLLLRKILR